MVNFFDLLSRKVQGGSLEIAGKIEDAAIAGITGAIEEGVNGADEAGSIIAFPIKITVEYATGDGFTAYVTAKRVED